MIKRVLLAAVVASLSFLAGCPAPADVASQNLSKAADNFEVNRRIVFYNGITDGYMLTIQGMCSLGNSDKAREVSVTCKVGPGVFKKHFLGISDNVTFFVEQLDPVPAGTYNYRVQFRPTLIVPDLDVLK